LAEVAAIGRYFGSAASVVTPQLGLCKQQQGVSWHLAHNAGQMFRFWLTGCCVVPTSAARPHFGHLIRRNCLFPVFHAVLGDTKCALESNEKEQNDLSSLKLSEPPEVAPVQL